VALHWVGSVSTAKSPGQFNRGGSVSTTTTSKAHTRALLAASLPRQMTVVVPMGNSESDGGTHAAVAPGQLSATCAEKVARAEHRPGSEWRVMLVGQVTTGSSVSLTVTLNEQLAELPLGSVAVQTTERTPLLKRLPDGGLHERLWEQLSVALAAKVTLHREAAVDDLADLCDLRLGQITHPRRAVDPCLLEHVARGGRANAEDVSERHVDALLARDIDASDSSHLLSLPLLMFRLGADHEDLPLAPDDLAFIATLLD